MPRPLALTIAGFDSFGAAGAGADAAAFAANGASPLAALALVTAQNARGVVASQAVLPELVAAQVESVLSHHPVAAVKTGALGAPATAAAVAGALTPHPALPLVVDPILAASDGTPLLGDGGAKAIRDHLLPLATLATPNLAEAAALTGLPVGTREEMEAAGQALLKTGCEAVLVTGGHLGQRVVADVLVSAAGARWWESPRLHGRAPVRGTGCAISAAITAKLALGVLPEDAISQARAWLATAIASAVEHRTPSGPVFTLGHLRPATP